jgi:hypothetical protein
MIATFDREADLILNGVFTGHAPQPLRHGEIVTYCSKTAYGNALLPALVMTIERDHVGLRVFIDQSGGSEWQVNSKESSGGNQPGCFVREIPRG